MPLQPIEAFIRKEPPPPESALMVRGGPITLDKLGAAAVRQARAYSLQGLPMVSVSVHAVLPDGSLEGILSGQLRTYTTYAAAPALRFVQSGFTLLPTFAAPHFDIGLPDASAPTLKRLLAILGPSLVNPFKGRR